MSTFKRLFPAPPPTTNAWSINQLINITNNDHHNKSPHEKTHSSDSDDSFSSDDDIEIISGQLKSIYTPHSPISPSIKECTTAATTALFLAPFSEKSNSNSYTKAQESGYCNGDDEEVLVSVGKYTKIKKPKFPKSNKIKGGSGHYKYKITDSTKDSPPFIINTNSPCYSEHSPISPEYQFTATSSPFIDSTASSPLVHTPLRPQTPQTVSAPHLLPLPIAPAPPPPSPSVVVYPQFGIPVYHISMISKPPVSPHPVPSSPVIQQPISPKGNVSVKKENIKRQIEYYFSTENLCKDTYLRSLFNKNDGSVKLDQLLEFNRMKILTKNGKYTNLLLESIEEIPVLELVDNECTSFRLKNWQAWVI